jgi:hypothetical protein
MPAYCQSFNVLEHESACSELRDDADELKYQIVPWVFECSVPNQRKPLARRAPEDAVYGAAANSRSLSNVIGAQSIYRMRYDCAIWKIELVRCAVNRVDLNCGAYIEPCLLEPQTHSASPSKEVDSGRPHMFRNRDSLAETFHPDRVGPSRKETSFEQSASVSFISHCQIVSTDHPESCSFRTWSASRFLLFFSFGFQ